jgi:hypothetical protein
VDQWKNDIKKMAIIKPAFAFCDSKLNMTDVNFRVAYQVDQVESHLELDDDNVGMPLNKSDDM